MIRFHAPALLSIALALAAGLAAPASAAMGDWAVGDKARVRLIAAGLGADGTIEAGIEIDLAPGWHTYWRTPGAAGIAPISDFSASTNLGDVAIHFPVPHRYDDGYGVSNVYDGVVVLPLDLAPGDGDAPLDLRLSLDIGVCEVVCIPEHFDVELTVPPGVSDFVAARVLTEARAKLPGPPEPGVLAAEGIVRHGGTDKRPAYDVTLAAPADVEVFVEGPHDWYAGLPERVSEEDGRATYRVTFDRLGAKTPLEGARFTVTLVAADRAIEQTIGEQTTGLD